MAEIAVFLTEDASQAWAGLFGGLAQYLVPDDAPPTEGWNPKITHFRIGEGGWVDNGAGPVPRTPISTLRHLEGENTSLIGLGAYPQDLDALIDAERSVVNQRYPANRRYSFEKALIGANVTQPSYGMLRIACGLTAGEANDNGFALSPRFWEIGLYGTHPDPAIVNKFLIAYGTFPVIEKTIAAPETVVVNLYFKAP